MFESVKPQNFHSVSNTVQSRCLLGVFLEETEW